MQIYKLFSEVETFFKKDDDNAIQAMICALKAMKLNRNLPTLATKWNARMKTSEKLMVLLLLPFFGCKDVSHLPSSQAGVWFSAGYNMLYRLMRDSAIDWRRFLSLVSSRVASYIDNHCEKQDGKVRCLVADDTDIAKSGMRIEKIGRIFSHTQHRHIIGFKGLLLGINDGVTFRPLDFSLLGEKGGNGTQGLTAKPARKQPPVQARPPLSGTESTSRARLRP